ncbi:MAG: protein phosphatase 2C domain-containing protein [Leptolyngbya sp. Prado105]|jgi:hypothetical protein|nr:protein phosphatase 2C domain-containing protein [Leptolyngbya sp. Prado105]
MFGKVHECCDGCSVRGASHKRNRLVNQDALHHEVIEIGQARSRLLAVSDGHGGQAYFRSQIGAQVAVQSAAIVVKCLAQSESIAAELPKAIVEHWQMSVIEHWQQQPFTAQEWQQVPQCERLKIEQNPAIAYGATLLLVLITPQFGLYFQIGDGDILLVDRTGKTQYVLPKDDRQFANQTISLCMPQAWRDCRMRVKDYSDQSFPAMILVATDGYANSYETDEDFLKIGADYLHSVRQMGFTQVIAQLPDILSETSRRGSGDDVTLGMIYLEDS